MKKLLLAVALIAIAAALATVAVADVDLNRKGTIALEMKDEAGQIVPGGAFALYRVGDVEIRENNLRFALAESFQNCAVSLENPALSAVAESLAAYAAQHPEMESRVQTADAKGRVAFENVECGLYLIVQTTAADGYEAAKAFVVSMPMSVEGGEWTYNVTAKPKAERTPEPQPTPEPTTPPGDRLPQTGMLKWPVPVLAAVGVAVFAIGWVMAFGRKKHE
ncbi:MAG: SpaA isopeptide-forming pilin-related protein [Candidatus Faecivicinus sp.]|nr:SpaA isopeptide-forming pilin-related protein [Candidatus Faecivicinus sp.]